MDEVERMAVGVRADTAGFAREVETMRATLEDELGAGADRAGQSIERALLRAARTGQFGFDDLKATALGVPYATLERRSGGVLCGEGAARSGR
jgi:hypothetical protein